VNVLYFLLSTPLADPKLFSSLADITLSLIVKIVLLCAKIFSGCIVLGSGVRDFSIRALAV